MAEAFTRRANLPGLTLSSMIAKSVLALSLMIWELIGVYARVTCGRGAAKGLVELKCIGDETPRDIPASELVAELTRIFAE